MLSKFRLTLFNIRPIYIDVFVSVRSSVFVEKSQSVHDLMYDSTNPLAANADGNGLLDVTGIPANPWVTPWNCDNNKDYFLLPIYSC